MKLSTKEILSKEKLNRDDIISLLKITDETDLEILFSTANYIREKYCGNEVHIRAVIEFSNYCEENCSYCELREDNFSVKRYRLDADEIIETAKKISNMGFRTIYLQSGEDSFYDTDIIAYIIYSIKQSTDVAITLNIGQRNFEDYKTWKIAGADRYFLKFHTSNSVLYSMYHKKKNLFEKINHLKYLKRLGYQIGTGNIIGIPHQTIEDIADDIILCQELDVDMASFTPFIPHPFTPFQNKPKADLGLVYKTIAVSRILLKNIHVHACNSLEEIGKNGRECALKVGANIIIPDFSTETNSKLLLHPSKIKKMLENTEFISSKIELLGFKIATSQGNSLKLKALMD
ncbi:MAG: [FeFe] hydrogenase H-cluster radical SAM maturase HydE [bacterium]